MNNELLSLAPKNASQKRHINIAEITLKENVKPAKY
jgi:hypothetical protein